MRRRCWAATWSRKAVTTARHLDISLLSRNLGAGLELLADSAEHPTFPAADLERVRADRMTALLQQQDNPIELGMRAGSLNLFGSQNPYGYDALGTAGSLHAITRDEAGSPRACSPRRRFRGSVRHSR